jgi:hypothetical protein
VRPFRGRPVSGNGSGRWVWAVEKASTPRRGSTGVAEVGFAVEQHDRGDCASENCKHQNGMNPAFMAL